RPEVLDVAEQFLTIADYLNYLFSGVACCDESNASTTQMYDPMTRKWSAELISAFNLPSKLFPKIIPPGTRLGSLANEIATETNLKDIDVIATCSHDTGAAVAAVPAQGQDW